MRIQNLYMALALASAFVPASGLAQDNTGTTISIPPLFEYPTAPDDLTDLSMRSNYLVEHFWDKFNLKSKKTVDQNALNHAFSVYAAPMQWADKEVTHKAADKLIEQISKSPAMLLQMTKAAEENIYGPRAKMWIDEIYVKFLQALVKNKKTPELYKDRYATQLKKLTESAPGSTAPKFTYVNSAGETKVFKPSGNYTLIEFGDPTCYECRMAELKLESNARIDELVKVGKLNICFIIPSESEDWSKETAQYPENWIVGASDNADEVYDIRLSPTLYIIGPDGKILKKNIDIVSAIELLEDTIK